jgi:stress-induced morphogen
MSRVDRSRAVHAVLREELAGRVHALALELTAEGPGA